MSLENHLGFPQARAAAIDASLKGSLHRVPTAVAAKIVGVSSRTLEDWRAKGKGPRFVRIGKKVRYELAALHEFIAPGEPPDLSCVLSPPPSTVVPKKYQVGC